MARTITISKSQAQSFASVLCPSTIKSFAQSHPDYPAFVDAENRRVQEQEGVKNANIKKRNCRKTTLSANALIILKKPCR